MLIKIEAPADFRGRCKEHLKGRVDDLGQLCKLLKGGRLRRGWTRFSCAVWHPWLYVLLRVDGRKVYGNSICLKLRKAAKSEAGDSKGWWLAERDCCVGALADSHQSRVLRGAYSAIPQNVSRTRDFRVDRH